MTETPASQRNPTASRRVAWREGGESASRVIRSEELFAGGKIVLIQHAGEQYRLLITRNDRLILQK